MAHIQWTLTEADQKEYDLIGPQTFDTAALRGLRCSQLEELEAVTREHAGLLIVDLYPLAEGSMRGLRAVMWVSLRLAGRQIKWEDFDPQVLAVKWEDLNEAEGDALPPDSGPAGASSSEE